MLQFIVAHRHRVAGVLSWRLGAICAVLQIAPSTYHAGKPRPPSARAIRDSELRPKVLRVREENLAVYGADQVWDQLKKDGMRVARGTDVRLMADMGLQGCRSGRVWIRAAKGDHRLDRPPNSSSASSGRRHRTACGAQTSHKCKTNSGWVYVAFLADVFLRIVVG
ncbi:unannotated protein [freshwater metagenome]|uniref:Unannotated protein n=1 Tax=freshwater metagenome TaxID=449393 RepID=A0A6J6PY01_9ZZZZ